MVLVVVTRPFALETAFDVPFMNLVNVTQHYARLVYSYF